MKTSISFLKSRLSTEETIQEISKTDADFIHVDVMDGKFVERKVLEIPEVIRLLSKSEKPLDIHLMVEHPLEYISAFKNLNARYITIHYEIEDNIGELIELIHSYGIRAGLALNPDTPVSKLNKYLERIDYVLIMGVVPGYGGQSLIESTIDKIHELEKIRDEYNYHYQISFDGGVNGETRKKLEGLDIIISGSYVCMSDDYQAIINTLK